jgi:hypothetical protein
MPSAPSASPAVTVSRDQAGVAGTSAPLPAMPGPRTSRALLALRRAAGLLRRMPRTGSYRDQLFERPDLVEDDYRRFQNQP